MSEVPASRDSHFPGVKDFQLLSSDGHTFHLSRQVLTQTSGFFADMFAVGSRNPGTEPVTATEEFTVLHPVLCLVYARHGVSAPSISSFTTLTTLYRVAEKYEMHAVVQCLLSVLFHTRTVGAIPFVKIHPIPSLALLMPSGSQFGVQAALQECILGDKQIIKEIDVSGVQIDVRMVNYIYSERQNRIQHIMSNINHWSGCECAQGTWRSNLREAVDDNPTILGVSKYVYEELTCPYCGEEVTSNQQHLIDSSFDDLRTLEEHPIPLPSWYTF